MDLNRKLELAKQAVESITRHDDEPVAEREQIMDALLVHSNEEMQKAHDRESKKSKKGKAPKTPD